ncbi:hypothetical protein BJ912DRAFT_1105412 [Pholiota molesta]|nr:hypothetical protein BJ912DRAFT_1105412 [Pholiota molesta]
MRAEGEGVVEAVDAKEEDAEGAAARRAGGRWWDAMAMGGGVSSGLEAALSFLILRPVAGGQRRTGTRRRTPLPLLPFPDIPSPSILPISLDPVTWPIPPPNLYRRSAHGAPATHSQASDHTASRPHSSLTHPHPLAALRPFAGTSSPSRYGAIRVLPATRPLRKLASSISLAYQHGQSLSTLQPTARISLDSAADSLTSFISGFRAYNKLPFICPLFPFICHTSSSPDCTIKSTSNLLARCTVSPIASSHIAAHIDINHYKPRSQPTSNRQESNTLTSLDNA